ncbi:MAG TPA: nicotinate-nucleotide--dimethylbenzimidazole phosphoribosyltransferase [Clostridia bacterium]|nr:nicotinate-nucleotide--dimethylbenzimidazole phosphoribosyltransferase [Clostridia bacterium]
MDPYKALVDQLQEERALDQTAMAACRVHWDNIAKPLGSLGLLEDMVAKLAGIQGRPDVRIDKRALLVMCADNGVLAQGVAQTPGEITAVMAGFIAAGRSSVCIMANRAGAHVHTVDMGMFRALPDAGLLDRRIAAGTKDMTQGPAMSREEAQKAILAGVDLVADMKAQGYQILLTGEMGIGNTTTSSALASPLLDLEVEAVTGRGAGLSDEGLDRKIRAIQKAVEVNQPDPDDPLDLLHKLGGFDIAGLCGVFLGAALHGLPVLIDGFISAVSALLALRICPWARQVMLASHLSAEPASRAVLKALGLSPLIQAGMRLGEGTGAVAALPLLDMALDVYRDLITYEAIGM